MTNEEMATELRKAGWKVAPPLTQENCEHPLHMRRSAGSICGDGSGYSETRCIACGKEWKREWKPQTVSGPVPPAF